jgi:hypothetical protein
MNFPKNKNETRMHTVFTPIQHSTGIPTRVIRQEEGIKGIQIGKETVKISLLLDDIILYLKDPKTSTPKLLYTINSHSKVAGYKINKQKSLTFLYTNNEQSDKECMKNILFTIDSKKKSNT